MKHKTMHIMTWVGRGNNEKISLRSPRPKQTLRNGGIICWTLFRIERVNRIHTSKIDADAETGANVASNHLM
jgi:hypothetical protein